MGTRLVWRRCRQPPNAGITYMEILLGMLVLSVGILGVVGATSTAALDIFYAGRESFAAEQAQAILERVRNASSYEDLLSYADNPPPGATVPRPAYVQQNRDDWFAGIQGSGPGKLGQGQGRIAITTQGTLPDRLATVAVSIDWSGRTGANPPTFVTHVAEWP